MILNALTLKLKRQACGDFRGCYFEATLIVQAGSWYLRHTLSYRNIKEMLLERGLEVDQSTTNGWVLAYAATIERRLRRFRKPHCGLVRIGETYIKVRGRCRYLYRATNKRGTPVDFLLTATRDLDAVKRFFRTILQVQPLLAPNHIGTDGTGSCPQAIAESQKEGLLPPCAAPHRRGWLMASLLAVCYDLPLTYALGPVCPIAPAEHCRRRNYGFRVYVYPHQ